MSADDTFTGTASYYARYRPRIPQAVYDAVASAFSLDGSGRLLDVGCGTGLVAVALHDRFERVAAIDVSAQMLDVAREEARRAGATTIDWHELPGESISAALGTFRLVTCADALHWMDGDRVIALCHERIEPGGGIALLTAGSPLGTGAGDLPWQEAVTETIQRWLGPRRRAGSGYSQQSTRTWQEILAASPFVAIDEGAVTSALDWSFEQVLGNLYSTSYANRSLLGDDRERFEDDLRAQLARAEPSGHFEREIESSWIIGRVAP